jgi:hypothetical protein
MREIRHRGRVAAIVTGWDVVLSPHIAQLENDHPERRWVATLATFSALVDAGEIPGPWSDAAAGEFARGVLMPAVAFLPLLSEDDVDLAELFGAPLDQVAVRRDELLAWLPDQRCV